MTNSRSKSETRNADSLISIRNGASCPQKGSSNTKVAPKVKNSTNSKLEAKFEVLTEKVVLTLPLRTKSEANCFEPWRVKHDRHKKQQRAIAYALKPLRSTIQLPCSILLTRLAPRTLDKHDNLPMSFKYIVDACCAIITGNYTSGNADSDERISISYDQLVSKTYGIKIEIKW